MSEYNLFSAFDIEKHKATYINYLEVIIDPSGIVHYATPSHQEFLIKMACERANITREQLNNQCPREYYFDFMRWLIIRTGAVAVWNEHCMAVDPNIKQIATLRKLKMAGLYKGAIPKIVD